jgi:membrane protease YdiL (CAAX protease family)
MNTSNTKSIQMESRLTLRSWIQTHPIATFLLFVLVGSWSIWSLLFPIIGREGLLHNPPALAFLVVFLGQAWASLCGIFVTRLVDGREGMQTLWARFRHWRVDWWWLALLIIPSVTAVTPLLRWLAGYPVDTGAMLGLLIPGLILGVVSGFAEEFGWRGFLLPQLLKRFSPLVATLLVGLVWGGLWHGYADYIGLGDRGAATWLLVLLLGPCLLTAWSLIITSVYEHTQGSLLLSILMHASLSSSALIFGQSYTGMNEELLWNGLSVGVAFLGAAVIWLVTHRMRTSHP